MNTTVNDLKQYLKDIPNDYQVWIEYPARYGTAQPQEIETGIMDDQDAIPSMSMGFHPKKKRFYIFHHY